MPVAEYFQDDIILSQPLTVQEIERRAIDAVKKSTRDDIPQVPFGFINEHWETIKAEMKQGDTLVAFDTPQRDWDNLGGMRGYALIRGKMLINVIITECN